MNTKRPPNRRQFKVHRRTYTRLRRYCLIGLTAALLLSLAVALAYWMDKPVKETNTPAASSETVSDDISEEETTTAAEPTETTTTAAVNSSATTIKTEAVKPVGDEYFKDACFIGDSRTQGLLLYSKPKYATFLAIRGMTVAGFFTDKKFENKTLTAEAYLKTKKFGKVYVMLGLNELGWEHSDTFIKRYGDLVDSVKASQPNAKIFVQSIFPVSAAKSASNTKFTNPRVLAYNKLIYAMCVQKKVIYLNVREAVEDKNGNLPKDATVDGIHMNKAYCDKWLYYIRTHTEAPVATNPTTTTATTKSTTQSATAASAAATSTTAKPTATTITKRLI